MLFRKMRRNAVLIVGSGKVSSVCHGDARAGPDGFNTDDVIGVDISILRRSFDEYEFSQGLPSRLNRIRGEISAHNAVIGEQHATGCRTSATYCGYCVARSGDDVTASCSVAQFGDNVFSRRCDSRIGKGVLPRPNWQIHQRGRHGIAHRGGLLRNPVGPQPHQAACGCPRAKQARSATTPRRSRRRTWF